MLSESTHDIQPSQKIARNSVVRTVPHHIVEHLTGQYIVDWSNLALARKRCFSVAKHGSEQIPIISGVPCAFR